MPIIVPVANLEIAESAAWTWHTHDPQGMLERLSKQLTGTHGSAAAEAACACAPGGDGATLALARRRPPGPSRTLHALAPHASPAAASTRPAGTAFLVRC